MPIRRADDTSYTLGTNISATGSAIAIKGGEYMFTVEGTAAGTTASLQVQSLNGNWSDISVYSGSVVKSTTLPYVQTGVSLPSGNVRVALTSGTPSAVYAYLVGEG